MKSFQIVHHFTTFVSSLVEALSISSKKYNGKSNKTENILFHPQHTDEIKFNLIKLKSINTIKLVS